MELRSQIAFVVMIVCGSSLSPAEANPISRHFKFPSTAVVHKQFNFHVVAPGVWRSGATNKRTIKRMQQHGLKTIVNFKRNEFYHRKERRTAQKLGIQYYHYPMDPKAEPNEQVLNEILDVISNPANQPVLIHCQSGKDRTGLIAALYKLKYTDVAFEAAYQEMLMYGYNEKRYPQIVRTLRSWAESRIVETAMIFE